MILRWHARYPLLLPCFSLSIGIFLASHCSEIGRFCFAGVLLLSVVGFALCLHWDRERIRLWLIVGFFVLLGWLRVGDHFFKPLPEPTRQWIENKEKKEVLLLAEDYCLSDGMRSHFPAEILNWNVKANLTVGSATCPAAPGVLLRAWVKISEPRSFRNLASFDFARYLRGQGRLVTGFIQSVDEMFVVENPAWFFRQAHQVRTRIVAALEASVSSLEARGVLQAMLVRETKNLSSAAEESFRRTGLTHLLVVSGLNFSLALGVFYYPIYLLFSLYPRWSNQGMARRWALASAFLPTFFYALMVGATPSVLRALGMALGVVVALLISWRRDFFSLLLLTLLMLLLWQPLLLFDLSFQLSFLSVGSIYLFSLQLKSFLQGKRWWFRHGCTLLSSSIVVNLALYPLLANTFHEVSLLAPLANLIFVPFYSLILLPGGILGSFVNLFEPSLSDPIFRGLGWLTEKSLGLIHGMADISYATWLVPSLHGLLLLAYLFFLLSLFQLRNFRRLLLCWMVVVLLLGIHELDTVLHATEPRLRLTVLDVGQGEGMVLTLPDGEVVVIDGGGFAYSNFDTGKNILAPELLDRFQTKIAALVMSHPDADHYKGLNYLAKKLSVQEFWTSPSGWNHPDIHELKASLLVRQIPRRFLFQGQTFQKGGAGFEVLWPPQFLLENDTDIFSSDNNQSLVLRVCYQKVCFLLTGDIESPVEEMLLQGENDLESTVFKVPHHGSKNSSSFHFVERVAPQVAIISAGRNNRFGFPRPEVIKRFRELNVEVLRTDLEGEIEISTDGENIFYKTFSGLKKESLIKGHF